MIRGNIAIPDKDPKSWRAKGRKKRKQPVVASAIVTPAPMKKRSGAAQHSAIVEPKRRPGNAMLTHLLEDITGEERNRRADLADEMFREIVRRVAQHRRE